MGVLELHGGLDHVAAGVPFDAAVDDYSMDAAVVGVNVEVLVCSGNAE